MKIAIGRFSIVSACVCDIYCMGPLLFVHHSFIPLFSFSSHIIKLTHKTIPYIIITKYNANKARSGFHLIGLFKSKKKKEYVRHLHALLRVESLFHLYFIIIIVRFIPCILSSHQICAVHIVDQPIIC